MIQSNNKNRKYYWCLTFRRAQEKLPPMQKRLSIRSRDHWASNEPIQGRKSRRIQQLHSDEWSTVDLVQTRRLANNAIHKVQLSSAENALTCECGECDESTAASYVDIDHCYRLGAVSRTAEGFLGPAEGFARKCCFWLFSTRKHNFQKIENLPPTIFVL